jgi:hypothetical protein
MEWLKERQARHAHARPTPPEPEPEVASEGEAEAGSAFIEAMPVVPPPRRPPSPPVGRGRSWRLSRPRGHRGSGLRRCARPPASPRGRSPVRSMAWDSGGRSAKCTIAMWQRARSARRSPDAYRA